MTHAPQGPSRGNDPARPTPTRGTRVEWYLRGPAAAHTRPARRDHASRRRIAETINRALLVAVVGFMVVVAVSPMNASMTAAFQEVKDRSDRIEREHSPGGGPLAPHRTRPTAPPSEGTPPPEVAPRDEAAPRPKGPASPAPVLRPTPVETHPSQSPNPAPARPKTRPTPRPTAPPPPVGPPPAVNPPTPAPSPGPPVDATPPPMADQSSGKGKPNKPEKPGKPENPGNPGKPEKPGKPGKPGNNPTAGPPSDTVTLPGKGKTKD